ncbi:MAG: acyltransferase family protein, partial [Blautia sp.]|nr:acyltransferase family protein [Blautia sp.]
TCVRFHDSPPVIKSKKLSTKLFRLCSDESIISHRMILNRYSLFCVYVTFNQYWYFTAYSVLFLIMPFLDRLIRSVNWKKLLVFIAILSCYATVASYFTDVFELNGGYSFVWLACLYIVGAIIRKEELYKRCKKKCIMLILLFLIFITWIWKVWIGGLHEGLGNVPISYIAPNILGIAICFVLIFSSINIHSKWVKKIAASTFGIYLFHDQRIFRKHVIIARFKFIADMPIWSIPVMVIAISSILFLIGLLVDKIWSIFYKRLKIERMFG